MSEKKLRKYIKDCRNFMAKLEREEIKGEFQSVMMKAYIDNYPAANN